MRTIDFGIDLGTTNSLIAQYKSGTVEVLRNPVGFRETLPSCVAFRGERTLVGDKAREWLLKDPLNVFAGFKRKMGTSDNYFSPGKNNFYSPIQLSAMVLSELKNFVQAAEKPGSVVITIPASFDTVQSNATKKAGYEAGFNEVVLLQEPIAASLAFFNKEGEHQELKGKWLVYDLGGGTFDVALIGIDGSEMRVIDHQGDNFLGGLDFDHSLVMDVTLPKLIQQTGAKDLYDELNKRSGKYEKLYYILLLKCEEAKKELGNNTTVEIEFSYDFGNGEEDYFITITREELNNCIKPRIDNTMEMMGLIMSRNNLAAADLQEVIMIGGSTYIPYVRESVFNATGIKVNCSADPSTAVAIGAAYYAGSKTIQVAEPDKPAQNINENTHSLKLKLSYNKTTKDSEEYISGSVENMREGLQYRITRSDGGFDTGIKPLTARFGDFVTLREKQLNQFSLKIFDGAMNEQPNSSETIEITQGLFSLFGQPLPEDISIEVDDVQNNATKCETIFERNSILPLTKTFYREMSRTIKKGGADKLIINVLEGNGKSHPNTNQAIGVIEIAGSMLQGDLVKGSDVELRIEISESRDVTVKVNLLLLNQQFSNVFSPSEKYISLVKLQEELKEIKSTIQTDIRRLEEDEDYERMAELQELKSQVEQLWQEAMSIKEDDLSGQKYYIEERKRRLAQQIYGTEENPRLFMIKKEIVENRLLMEYWCSFDDMPQKYKDRFAEQKPKERTAFESNSMFQVDALLKAQETLISDMILNTPSLLINQFHYYMSIYPQQYKDTEMAKRTIEIGEKAVERQSYDELRSVVHKLNSLSSNTRTPDKIKGTGLS